MDIYKYILIFSLLFYINSYSHNCNIFVELSASSISYLVYLPVVIKSWNMIGFKSIVIITYYNLNKEIIYIKNILKKLGSDVILINFNYSVSLHYASKLIRIFGFEISNKVKNCDYLLLSDADMIPISKSFFYDLNNNKLTIKSFDRNGYGFGNNKGRWAMCYFIANKFIWKRILKIDRNKKNIVDIVSHTISSEIKKGKKYFEDFAFIDEVYMRDRIKEWKYYNSNVVFHPRNYHNTRIDRIVWPKNIFTVKRNNIIDIHLPKFPLKENERINLWMKKIIPLQLYLFNYTPFGISYINNILYYINSSSNNK